jgi:hypothetical protein
MIKIISKLLCLGTFLLTAAVAHGEDDVLSILGGDSAKPKTEKEAKLQKGAETSPFKALFPKTTAEQNILFSLMQAGEFEKALLQYFEAFGKSEAHKSANGQGLLVYLFLKNGMTVYGVESLFSNVDPKRLSPVLAEPLREMLHDNHTVWKLARIQWAPDWTKIFSPSVEVQVKSNKVFTAKDTEALKNLIKISAPGTKDRAAIQWQLVISMALSGDTTTAAKLLNSLMTTPENPVGMDLMNMTAARMLFENGYMDAAVKYYKKIPTKSEFWLDAQEEMGWSYLRKGEPQNTLAATESLLIPELQYVVGAETVFLRSLGQLKVCDYPGVLKTLATFRERFKPKTAEMLQLSQNANTPSVKEFIAKTKKQRLKMTELGKLAATLPRMVSRDESLYKAVILEREFERESEIAMGIYGRSLANGTSKVGFQGDMEIFKKSIESQLNGARNASLARMKVLANEEIADIHRLLQKMHIVEAEVLQQALTAQKVVQATKDSKAIEKKGTTVADARDQITFPAENGQVWFDEIGKYKVDVIKGCQAVKK